MKCYHVDIMQSALDDIRDIRAYIAADNPVAASQQRKRILSSAKSLARSPKRYRIRGKDLQGRELRFLPCDNYVLIYYVDDNNNIVHLIQVASSRRDIDSLIFPEQKS